MPNTATTRFKRAQALLHDLPVPEQRVISRVMWTMSAEDLNLLESRALECRPLQAWMVVALKRLGPLQFKALLRDHREEAETIWRLGGEKGFKEWMSRWRASVSLRAAQATHNSTRVEVRKDHRRARSSDTGKPK